MICQGCGVEAPTKYVSFHQNIGALLMRFSKSVEGSLCRDCIGRHFRGMTGTTLLLGWWGTISLVITPFILANNVVRYALCLGLPRAEAGAGPPVLTDDAAARLGPHAQDLFDRLGGGADLGPTAEHFADLAGVTPGQVVLYVRAVAQDQRRGR